MMLRFPRVDHIDHRSSSTFVAGPTCCTWGALTTSSFSVLCSSAIAASVTSTVACVGCGEDAPSAFSGSVFAVSVAVIQAACAHEKETSKAEWSTSRQQAKKEVSV
ncbi:hypothetical protein K491DRAFT_689234 [Lophiostoma macrostomum CBS 122681]|uniref:Uncharacterized protein n=1 Tax=Lophiostoma macrostomum CBS 122681 TaxID=1314788 RepID=A0A6A6TK72_9PLEO|nr:hypothetical protein K491DRAFT_689234 [Lophiostoma macrostomum CBS 122681]